MENAAAKHPGVLPEFDKFVHENPAMFPRPTGLLSLNSGSVDAERGRLAGLQRRLQTARERAIQEAVERARTGDDPAIPGQHAVAYADALRSLDLREEDANKLHVLGLDTELSALQKEAEFHEQFEEVLKRASRDDPQSLENAMRNLVSAYYPNMADAIDRFASNASSKRPVFREEDLDREVEAEQRPPSTRRSAAADDFEYDIRRSPSPVPRPDPRQAREEERRRVFNENSELRSSVAQLAQEKEKIEASIRQASALSKSGVHRSTDRDPLNMTTTRTFNMRSFAQNGSSADLLRVLNDKEMQIDRLRRNLDRLQLTYSQVFDDDDTERTLRETDVDHDAHSYTSMLLQERRRSASALGQSTVRERLGEGSRYFQEGPASPAEARGGLSDYKRSYVI